MSKESLLYLANQGCITPHIWQSTAKDLDHPDRLVFDLDPPKNSFFLAVKGAKFIRDILEEDFKLKSYPMTTGRSGMHVIVPIKPRHTFEEVREFAKAVGKFLETERPKEFTTSPRKAKRSKKVYIDYLRNGYAQTAVAPYAVRAVHGGKVAMPLAWNELTKKLSPDSFSLKTIEKRLKKTDPWKGMRLQTLKI